MRATRQVCLQPDDGDGVVVTVSELTVAEVRSALLTDEAIGDPLQSLVFDGFGLGDLLAQCDASAADLERFTPSELAPLVDACRELNPFFFRVRAVLARSASEVLAAVEQMSLTAPAAS
jgi:hypothetical protein